MPSGISTTLTPEQRTLRASIAAYERWSREDGKANAERAQQGLREKFRREVAERHREQFEQQHPGETYIPLAPVELERRAESAYRAHFARLALASSKARRARKGATQT